MVDVFYLSIASGTQKRTAEALGYPYILLNFMTRSNTPPKTSKILFVDSGGFPSSFIHNGYNKTDLEYLHFVKKTKATYFALRDYPCEPQILQKHNTTAKNQILRTVEHHIKLLDLLDYYDLSAKPIPVIQGWEVGDYLFCIDLFREHGLISDYTAIGSLCRRNATTQIRKIILTIRQELKSSVKLHGFGVKLSALKSKAVWDSLYSVDSAAWDFDARWQRYRKKVNASAFEVSLKLAKQYLEKIDCLKRKFDEQSTLLPYFYRKA